MRSSNVLRAACLACFVLSITGTAFAAPSVAEIKRSNDLFAKGRTDELAAQYGEALKKFEEAQRLRPASGIVFHIAFCKEKIGRGLEAAGDYERASAMGKAEGKPQVVKEADARLAALAPKLARVVVVPPKDAADLKVTLDDRTLSDSELGTEIRVAAGAHKVGASARGARPFEASVDARDASASEVKIVFEKLAPTPTPAAAPVVAGKTEPARLPAPPPTAPSPETPSPTDGVTPPPSEPSKGSRYTAPIVVSVAAGAFAGFGLVSYLVAGGEQRTLKSQCPSLLPAACDELRGPVRTWDTLALVGFGAAGVGLVTAIVLFATAPSSAPAPATPSARWIAPELSFVSSGGTIGLRGVLP